jgi:hypothetical protein
LDQIARFAASGRHVVTEDDIPSGIFPGKWRQAVIDEQGRVNVVSFELCILTQLRNRVRAKEIWIEGADRYRNPDDNVNGRVKLDQRAAQNVATLKVA